MAFPSYEELEGLTWNELPDNLRNQLLAEFGYTETSFNPVPSFTQEQRDWLNGAFLVLSVEQSAIVESINDSRNDLLVGTRTTTDGRIVATAYALTDPPSYGVYYGVLHNAPFAHLSDADFPQPEIP